ncbi:hypothetical protein CVT25_000649 [Psilocybe cyanescens]|uniref:Peptidase C14 caspase domain-containing protein n=1 Tax=Psilocybe cyanescens TaxID=93625 RepID=A0A409WZI2_PSICY|nr:hypothetical protein CVT25_000649 [Psilocybe cyanescens]
MPEIFKELDANIKSCRKSVQQLPRPLPDNPQSEIATLVYNFVSDLEKHVAGVPNEDGLLRAIHPAKERFKRAVCTTAPKLRPFERKYKGERRISRAHFLVEEDGRVCNDEQSDYEDEDDVEEEDPQNDNSTHEFSVRSPAKRKPYPTNKIYIDECSNEGIASAMQATRGPHAHISAYMEYWQYLYLVPINGLRWMFKTRNVPIDVTPSLPMEEPPQEMHNSPNSNPAPSLQVEEPSQEMHKGPDSPRLGHLDWKNFHALLTGIDEYPPELSSLGGAVRDMENMKKFLVAAFDVPEGSNLDIRQLKNKDATRANIILEIRKLKTSGLVKMNNAIFIFYAGHGATMPPPEGWPGHSATPPAEGWPEAAEIQCIVASDAGLGTVQLRLQMAGQKPPRFSIVASDVKYFANGVVLDRTLAALLHDLADSKGNNITVILDCCHSGSGTRDALEPEIVRGVEFKDPEGTCITVQKDYDQETWDKFIDSGRGSVIDHEYRHAGLSSHVVLAVCGSKEKASDGYSLRKLFLII